MTVEISAVRCERSNIGPFVFQEFEVFFLLDRLVQEHSISCYQEEVVLYLASSLINALVNVKINHIGVFKVSNLNLVDWCQGLFIA